MSEDNSEREPPWLGGEITQKTQHTQDRQRKEGTSMGPNMKSGFLGNRQSSLQSGILGRPPSMPKKKDARKKLHCAGTKRGTRAAMNKRIIRKDDPEFGRGETSGSWEKGKQQRGLRLKRQP